MLGGRGGAGGGGGGGGGGADVGAGGLDGVEGARTNSSTAVSWVGVFLPTVSGSSSEDESSSSSICKRLKRLGRKLACRVNGLFIEQ